ncbi:MAG: metal-dependent transcriptional regulator, partial [Thermodesulfovibrionales bacterium]|nr:metal-dependent transcriptional regulator [Thermodesulfovibrionales bacterium]
MEKERIEEALELLWVLNEEGFNDLKRFIHSSDDPNVDLLIDSLIKSDYAKVEKDQIILTPKGYELAKALIRRHRLAERLFTDVFDLSKDVIHEDACKMEHVLSEELTDSVCTFLGHPPTCPHGKPLPQGECCKKYTVEIHPLVVKLTDFETGIPAKVVFIKPSDAMRLSRLSSIGIMPGAIIKLLQRKPSVVIQIDETIIAIDHELANEI